MTTLGTTARSKAVADGCSGSGRGRELRYARWAPLAAPPLLLFGKYSTGCRRALPCGGLRTRRGTGGVELRVRSFQGFDGWVDSPDVRQSGETFDHTSLSLSSLSDVSMDEELVYDPLGFVEKVILVGVGIKIPPSDRKGAFEFTLEESLEELERLADAAGLKVVGRVMQMLPDLNSRAYLGSGKIMELNELCARTGAVSVLCDDELSPRQQRNLEKALDNDVRVGDRTALILDVFSQRAATKEGKLQVELAKAQYELPRLTRMWSHLERQAGGGQVKGMGEKQIEIDKRLLRKRMQSLSKDIDEISGNRSVYRRRRQDAGLPVAALVGYTNAGKSTLLNAIADANALAEDKLFATLDPTTRRMVLGSGKEVLITDTVGFIQKLPTQLVAAFRATLEEITEASVLIHVVDVSDPKAAAQSEAVFKVLKEIGADNIPVLTVWNKVDMTADPEAVAQVAVGRRNTACISAVSGFGIDDMLSQLEQQIELMMAKMKLLVPYSQGDLMGELYKKGFVNKEEFRDQGVLVKASVPPSLVSRCQPLVTDEAFTCHGSDDEDLDEPTAI